MGGGVYCLSREILSVSALEQVYKQVPDHCVFSQTDCVLVVVPLSSPLTYPPFTGRASILGSQFISPSSESKDEVTPWADADWGLAGYGAPHRYFHSLLLRPE